MLVNYGAHTALVTFVAHLAYGAIVGGFTAGRALLVSPVVDRQRQRAPTLTTLALNSAT